MFLGTPHHGSDYGLWVGILGRIANMGFLKPIRTDLLKDLEPKSEKLAEICSQFVKRAEPLQIVTVYETQKMKGLDKLVRETLWYVLW